MIIAVRIARQSRADRNCFVGNGRPPVASPPLLFSTFSLSLPDASDPPPLGIRNHFAKAAELNGGIFSEFLFPRFERLAVQSDGRLRRTRSDSSPIFR